MFDQQKLYFKNIRKSLNSKIWKNETARHKNDGWLNFAVGRRLLHRHLLAAKQEHELDSIEASASKLQSILNSLKLATMQLPQDTVVVEGDMAKIRMSEWLCLEAFLVQQILMHTPKRKVKSTDLMRLLPSQGYCPSFIRKCNYKWVSVARYSPWALTGHILGFCSTIALAALGFEYAVLVTAITTLGLLWVTFFGRELYDCVAGSLVEEAGKGLSLTWDDVFAMRTEMDAVLLGVLFEVINQGRVHNPDRVMPDFLAMSPYQAYSIAIRALTGAGLANEALSNTLFDAVENIADTEDQSDKGSIQEYGPNDSRSVTRNPELVQAAIASA